MGLLIILIHKVHKVSINERHKTLKTVYED